MEDAKFVISPKRYKEESQVFSVRMPKDMLRDVDAVAQKTGRTRNEILLKCIEFTLTHLEIAEKE
jgi:predicted DNA-binding protein